MDFDYDSLLDQVFQDSDRKIPSENFLNNFFNFSPSTPVPMKIENPLFLGLKVDKLFEVLKVSVISQKLKLPHLLDQPPLVALNLLQVGKDLGLTLVEKHCALVLISKLGRGDEIRQILCLRLSVDYFRCNTTVSFDSFVVVQYDCKFPWLRSSPIRL
jgi:hypothetical protein